MTNRNFQRGGILSGLLWAALAIVCIVAICGLIVARNVRVLSVSKPDGADVSIDTPAGHLTVNAHRGSDEALAGIPDYPGAVRRGNSGGAVVDWAPSNGSTGKDVSVAGIHMETSDPPEKVIDFYREHLPEWTVVKEGRDHVRLELSQGSNKHVLSVEIQHGKTAINIGSVGPPAAN